MAALDGKRLYQWPYRSDIFQVTTNMDFSRSGVEIWIAPPLKHPGQEFHSHFNLLVREEKSSRLEYREQTCSFPTYSSSLSGLFG
jgi:hypothetical protein